MVQTMLMEFDEETAIVHLNKEYDTPKERERINGLQWFTAFGLFWAALSTFYLYVMELRPSSAPLPSSVALLFVVLIGLMFFLDIGMGREYRKRFEDAKEGSA